MLDMSCIAITAQIFYSIHDFYVIYKNTKQIYEQIIHVTLTLLLFEGPQSKQKKEIYIKNDIVGMRSSRR